MIDVRYQRNSMLALAVLVVLSLIVGSCGDDDGSSGTISADDAEKRLSDCVDKIGWVNDPVDWKKSIDPTPGDLARALPEIDENPLVVSGSGDVVIEIFASTEKSGSGTDGWVVEVAEAFNSSNPRLADGSTVGVSIRKIASGRGYLYIGSEQYQPHGFTPSNVLWVEMAAARGVKMTAIADRLVPNVAGIVMTTDTAARLEQTYGALDPQAVVNAVVAGDLTMAYTNPFESSTGLNFLVTTLSSFAGGDESRLLDPDVVSTFESFQSRVPFTALTTLQIRESVEAGGSLDAFVMEWQTYTKTDSLRSGYRFIPFGILHDNPLYGVGDLSAQQLEALQAFSAFAAQTQYTDLAAEYGFDPAPYTPAMAVPSGATLISAQQVWKERKDGGRSVAAVFVADVSGSMSGTRIVALKEALLTGMKFIAADNYLGVVEFDNQVRLVLPLAQFDLNQQALFAAAVTDMDAAGGTAMYDGVCLGLQMLVDAVHANPDVKPMLFVLTDGETSAGHTYGQVDEIIAGLNYPVHTVGFEANIDELARLSGLVESASINASEGDVKTKITSMFNTGL